MEVLLPSPSPWESFLDPVSLDCEEQTVIALTWWLNHRLIRVLLLSLLFSYRVVSWSLLSLRNGLCIIPTQIVSGLLPGPIYRCELDKWTLFTEKWCHAPVGIHCLQRLILQGKRVWLSHLRAFQGWHHLLIFAFTYVNHLPFHSLFLVSN